ncbi:hypothetical protein CWI38_2313p0010, partial [Hamiltosporidium tvaerminnensis]
CKISTSDIVHPLPNRSTLPGTTDFFKLDYAVRALPTLKAKMLLQHLDCLEKHKNTSTKRAAILKLEEEVTKKKLEEAQLANLYNEIKNRKLHSIVNDSSRWLKNGSIRPPDQASDYTRPKNESIGVKNFFDNERTEVKVNTRIKTDVKIRITLIKLGITSQDSLQIVETEKLKKYELLANKFAIIHKCCIKIIPYVMTWNDVVKRLQIPMNVEAGAPMHKKPTHPLKQVDNEEDGVKTEFRKSLLPLILDSIITAEEHI